ncbi:MAG: XRE family transcriptional regulator [Acidimicrobiales bacterium]|nr:helix-turn-helix transcriptional regulator [Hyphomonadaceae bacterium]RZV39173.1 MAG: XRE family transcriptional regulator [Acidimicrobiales bacterium]
MRIAKPRSATYVDIHVGIRLKVLRKSNQLSQSNLGDEIGVTFQQIQKYERGTNRISVSRLWQFCEFFEVNPDFFYRGIKRQRARSPNSVNQSRHPVSH